MQHLRSRAVSACRMTLQLRFCAVNTALFCQPNLYKRGSVGSQAACLRERKNAGWRGRGSGLLCDLHVLRTRHTVMSETSAGSCLSAETSNGDL